MHPGTVIRLIVVAGIFLVLERFGAVTWLGAHPFWAKKTAYIGIGIGVIVSLLTLITAKKANVTSIWLPIAFVVLTGVIAAITLLYGKAEFAASYAENGFAGRVWYIGFVALIAGLYSTFVVFIQINALRQVKK
jgi:hypothetical protein